MVRIVSDDGGVNGADGAFRKLEKVAAHAVGLLLVVRHPHERSATAFENRLHPAVVGFSQCDYDKSNSAPLGVDGVARRGGFVQQQHLGLQGDAERDVRALGLASREVRPGFAHVGWLEADLVKERGEVFGGAGAAGAQGAGGVKEVLWGALEGDTCLVDVGDGDAPVGGAELLGRGVVEGDGAALIRLCCGEGANDLTYLNGVQCCY